MSTRAFHNKDRHGCLTCKQRRKKCGMQRPVCVACRRLGLVCVYQNTLHSNLTRQKSTTEVGTSISLYPHSLYEALRTHSKNIETADFELASHFLQSGDGKVATIPGLAALKCLDLVSIGPRYPYLLHGILAASALHLASTEAETKTARFADFKTRAGRHQQLALWSYTRSLQTISAQSCQYMFWFSIILAGLHLAFCSTPSVESSSTVQSELPLDDIIGVFRLLQGAVAVADEAHQWIPERRAELRLLPIRAILQSTETEVEGTINAAFEALIAQIDGLRAHLGPHPTCIDQSSTEPLICLSAAKRLRNVFGHLQSRSFVTYKAVIGWLAFVDRSYVDMVRARHPIALIVLSYFGVALHEIQSVWWVRDIGMKLILTINRILHSLGAHEWYTLSAWAVFSALNHNTSHIPRDQVHLPPLVEVGNASQSHNKFELAYDYTFSVSFIREEGRLHALETRAPA